MLPLCRPYAVRVRVGHTHMRCRVVDGCDYRSLPSAIHHLRLFAAALLVCVTDPRTLWTEI